MRPVTLCDLPDEVLALVIEHFLPDWDAYQRAPNPRILVDLARLNRVNRRIHWMTLPDLWAHPTFPLRYSWRALDASKDLLIKTVWLHLKDRISDDQDVRRSDLVDIHARFHRSHIGCYRKAAFQVDERGRRIKRWRRPYSFLDIKLADRAEALRLTSLNARSMAHDIIVYRDCSSGSSPARYLPLATAAGTEWRFLSSRGCDPSHTLAQICDVARGWRPDLQHMVVESRDRRAASTILADLVKHFKHYSGHLLQSPVASIGDLSITFYTAGSNWDIDSETGSVVVDLLDAVDELKSAVGLEGVSLEFYSHDRSEYLSLYSYEGQKGATHEFNSSYASHADSVTDLYL